MITVSIIGVSFHFLDDLFLERWRRTLSSLPVDESVKEEIMRALGYDFVFIAPCVVYHAQNPLQKGQVGVKHIWED